MWAAGPVDRNKPVTVRFEKATPSKPIYHTKYADPFVTITLPDGAAVLTYRHGRPEPGRRFPLTDYIHPLVGLDGEPLTALRPQDHEHHRGVFWAWVRHEHHDESIGDWWHAREVHLDPGPLRTSDGPIFSRTSPPSIPGSIRQKTLSPSRSSPNGSSAGSFPPRTWAGHGHRDHAGSARRETSHRGHAGGRRGTAASRSAMPRRAIRSSSRTASESRDTNQLRARGRAYSGIFLRRPGQPNNERTGAAMFVDPHHPDFPPEWITRFYGLMNVSYPGLRSCST